MNRDDFAGFIDGFVHGHRPGRNLYVWRNTPEDAARALRAVPHVVDVDITSVLPDPEACPRPDAEARELLSRRLEEKLTEAAGAIQAPGAIIVRGAALLARYGLGLGQLFPFAGDRRLILILAPEVSGFPSALQQPPRGLRFAPNRVPAMFEDIVGKRHVVEVE